MTSTPEQFELPERLQELSDETQQIVDNAIAFEHDINSCGANFEKKQILIKAAITDLDRRAMQVFFGQRVEIEGAYSYPIPLNHGSDVILKTIHEYGVRRGESQGFYGQLVEMNTETEEMNPDELQAKLFHGITLGTMAVQSSYFSLVGEARLQAPVTESGLSLCSVEDYRTLIAAEQKVTENEKDKQWADKVDSLLYAPDGPDLKQLGDILNRLRLTQGDKVHDYVTYINCTLKSGDDVVAVLCDHLLDYGPDSILPQYISSPELITGWDPTVGIADAYKINRRLGRAVKLKMQEPVLTMRGKLLGGSEEHVLHIPLEAIQCSEFK